MILHSLLLCYSDLHNLLLCDKITCIAPDYVCNMYAPFAVKDSAALQDSELRCCYNIAWLADLWLDHLVLPFFMHSVIITVVTQNDFAPENGSFGIILVPTLLCSALILHISLHILTKITQECWKIVGRNMCFLRNSIKIFFPRQISNKKSVFHALSLKLDFIVPFAGREAFNM